MNSIALFTHHRAWMRIHLPVALLMALLQRTPVLRFLSSAEGLTTGTTKGAMLRSAVATMGSLGAMHSLAGATVLVATRESPASLNAGEDITPIGFTVTSTTNIAVWRLGGNLPPGLKLTAAGSSLELSGPGDLDATTPGSDDGYGGTSGGNPNTIPLLVGKPTQPGIYTITLQALQGPLGYSTNTFNYTINVAGTSSAPTFTTQPTSRAASVGAAAVFSAAASGTPAFQWQQNGTAIAGATSSTLTVNSVQPASAGIYTAVVTSGGTTATSQAAILGVSSTTKLIGAGTEFPDIFHPGTGFTYDQVLLGGAAASVTADSAQGQILRISFLDLNDDIVQVEFSGPGTLTLVLDNPSGPAAPQKYNQPTVNYMKGHVGIVLTGANQNTNLTVFSVGRGIAGSNPNLFRSDVTYDGFADIAFIAISSTDGKFGGLRAANASLFATRGLTGVYAPDVQFGGPVFVSDISTSGDATPVLRLGSGSDVRITGGDLLQTNGRAVQVSGITQLKFTAGSDSHGNIFAAKMNQAQLDQGGVNMTAQIVVNPAP